MRPLIPAMFVLGALCGQDSAPADYKKARLAEVTTLLPQLQELAKWCHASTLFRERDRVNALVITLDADNAAARAALAYKRKPDGTWSRTDSWREGRNGSEKHLREYVERRAQIVDPIASRLIAALDREKTRMEPARRDLWVAELLEIAPESAQVREACGEKRLGDKWVLAETASFAERRPEYLALAAIARDAGRTFTDGTPSEFESKLSLKWTAVRQSPSIRLVTTVPPSQVDKTLSQLDAAWTFAHTLFGIEVNPAVQANMVIVKSPEEAAVYLAAHPETPAPDRGKPLLGYTLSHSNVAVVGWETDSERLFAARCRVSALFLAWGLGTEDRPSWVYEGLGSYLVFLFTGTVRPFHGAWNDGGPLGKEVAAALAKPKANWHEIAANLVRQGKAPSLETLMTVGLFKMNPVDTVFSAALMSYFLEGRPSDASSVVRAVSKPMAPDVAIRETLALELPALEKRFHRWIQEVSVLPPPKR